jgi:hypothetical protein
MLSFKELFEKSSELDAPPVNDGKVRLTHWSANRLDAIDPRKAGTGPLKGQERGRAGPSKSYYGIAVGEPGGYKRENGLGPVKHTVHMDHTKLYDLHRDPDNLKHDDLGEFENRIQSKGYEGYWAKHHELGLTAAVFTPQTPSNVEGEAQKSPGRAGVSRPSFMSRGARR